MVIGATNEENQSGMNSSQSSQFGGITIPPSINPIGTPNINASNTFPGGITVVEKSATDTEKNSPKVMVNSEDDNTSILGNGDKISVTEELQVKGADTTELSSTPTPVFQPAPAAGLNMEKTTPGITIPSSIGISKPSLADSTKPSITSNINSNDSPNNIVFPSINPSKPAMGPSLVSSPQSVPIPPPVIANLSNNNEIDLSSIKNDLQKYIKQHQEKMTSYKKEIAEIETRIKEEEEYYEKNMSEISKMLKDTD